MKIVTQILKRKAYSKIISRWISCLLISVIVSGNPATAQAMAGQMEKASEALDLDEKVKASEEKQTGKAEEENSLEVTSSAIEAKQKASIDTEVLHNPVRNEETGMTDYSFVWFGSYPQSEVSGSALTSAIVNASYDSRGDAEVAGVKYRRLSKDMATFANTNGWYGNNFDWSAGGYHYFKYEPIQWRVLENDGSRLLLLAEQALDDQRYHKAYENITWENSDIRAFLNRDFYQTAFDTREQAAVLETEVTNGNASACKTAGGKNTKDQVFLLSYEEVIHTAYGFNASYGEYDQNRQSKSSAYAKAMGVFSSADKSTAYGAGGCYWWLRSPGYETLGFMHVSSNGDLNLCGNYARGKMNAVRPALSLKLQADVWSMEPPSEQDIKDRGVSEGWGENFSYGITKTEAGMLLTIEGEGSLASVRFPERPEGLFGTAFAYCEQIKEMTTPKTFRSFEPFSVGENEEGDRALGYLEIK